MARYQLDSLGWHQFELMCLSLLKTSLSIGIESWGGRSDRGRDAYSAGAVRFAEGDVREGPVAFQVKFVSGSNAAGAKPREPILQAVRSECTEISKRIEKHQWGSLSDYVLITNAPISSDLRGEVETKLKEVLPQVRVTVWGCNDVCDMLDDAPRLRIAFPQILGIRDFEHLLSNVVNKATIERSRAAIEYARDIALVFVPTNAYYRALNVLAKHSFVVLTGPPEMGKTTIARMIGLAHLSQGWDYYDCLSPTDFFNNIDADKNQVFVADDAFGTTEYHPELAIPWGKQLSEILRRLGPKRWLIWTTRPVPLKFALRHIELQDKAEYFPKPADVEVNASNLSFDEKAKILYRHAKSANLSDNEKKFLKLYINPILSEPSFTPERIRRFVKENVRELCRQYKVSERPDDSVEEAVTAEIAEPTRRMRKSFDLIGDDHKYLMIAMLDAATGIAESEAVEQSYNRIFGERVDVPAGQIAKTLDGHFIRIYPRGKTQIIDGCQESERYEYDWIHPSWRDLTIDCLSERTKLRKCFLSRCSLEGVSLALSVGGGETGQRRLPLLVNNEDWKTLEQRVSEIAQTVPEFQLHYAFRVIGRVLGNCNDAESTGSKVVGKSLIGAFLNAVRIRWNENAAPINCFVLRDYFRLSTELTPIPSSPNLEPTWAEVRDALSEQVQHVNDISWLGDPLSNFLNLLDLLIDNEPRFARQKKIQSEYATVMENLLDRISSECQDRWSDSSDNDELDNAAAEVDEFESIALMIADLFPALGDSANELCTVLNYERDLIRDAIEENEDAAQRREDERLAEEEEYHAYDEMPEGPVFQESRSIVTQIDHKPPPPDWRGPSTAPDISEIFSDL